MPPASAGSTSYLIVSGLLKPGEIEFILGLLDSAAFEDGAGTATNAAKSVKKNLQLPRQGSPEKQQIGAVVLHAIQQSPLIHSALMPKMVMQPLVSRYEPGMHYPKFGDEIEQKETKISKVQEIAATGEMPGRSPGR